MRSPKDPETVLDELIVHQRAKLLALANRINPSLTPDDIAQPHDWPELVRDAQFQYEDGLLAGLLAAQMAMRAERGRGGHTSL